MIQDKLIGRLAKGMLNFHETYRPIVRHDIFDPRGDHPDFDKTIAFYGRDKRIGAGKVVDMTKWYNYTTFDIDELALAEPFHSLVNSNYHPWIALLCSSINFHGILVFRNHYTLLKPLLSFLLGKDMARQHAESRKLSKKGIELGDDPSRKDFMTYILRQNSDGKGMTHEEAVVNTQSLIVAGSETTATALLGLTFHLGQNPTIYKRLSAEIAVAQLPYLNACPEEILRIYPLAPETPPRNFSWRVCGRTTLCSIYQWATHHSPRNFADPDKFVPERWLPTQLPMYNPSYKSDNKGAFKPFAYWPRDCVGQTIAYADMRLVMSRLLWNFDYLLEPGQSDWVEKQRTLLLTRRAHGWFHWHP
ncbi:cytochrome P450 3A17 [Xylariaceae sp. FL1272]|nr:cytochrome P450 3A17 [Xylariaceae sp. FL1272]